MVFGRPNRWPAPAPLRAWEYPLLVLLVAGGVALRGWDRSDVPLWSDEAETSLNALTILEGGLPRHEYLGLPIFENTLTKPWPGNAEYEFRDTSYSEDGLAIYHGWLPLYAQAASFALTGIAPDRAPSSTPRYSEAEMRHRTWAARLPALLFSAIFIVAAFLTGRELYGTDGAWTAAVAAAVSTSAITFGQQGRYYSATLAMTTLCCWGVCLVLRRGRWRDFTGAAISLVLLFHTHILSFVVVCAVAVLVLPFTLGTRSIVRKLVLGAAIVLAGTVPWVLYTGFFEAAADRPSALSLLSAEDILRYPLERWPYVLLAVVAIAWLVAAPRLRNRVGGRFVEPFVGYRRPLFLLAAWALIAYAAFVTLIPAASFSRPV